MQTIFVILVALVAGIVLAHTTFGEKVYAIGGNERAATFAGVNTRRVRFTALVMSATCAARRAMMSLSWILGIVFTFMITLPVQPG